MSDNHFQKINFQWMVMKYARERMIYTRENIDLFSLLQCSPDTDVAFSETLMLNSKHTCNTDKWNWISVWIIILLTVVGNGGSTRALNISGLDTSRSPQTSVPISSSFSSWDPWKYKIFGFSDFWASRKLSTDGLTSVWTCTGTQSISEQNQWYRT